MVASSAFWFFIRINTKSKMCLSLLAGILNTVRRRSNNAMQLVHGYLGAPTNKKNGYIHLLHGRS